MRVYFSSYCYYNLYKLVMKCNYTVSENPTSKFSVPILLKIVMFFNNKIKLNFELFFDSQKTELRPTFGSQTRSIGHNLEISAVNE